MISGNKLQVLLIVVLSSASIFWLTFPESPEALNKLASTSASNNLKQETSAAVPQLDEPSVAPVEQSQDAVNMVKRLGGTVRLTKNGEVIVVNLTGREVSKDDLFLLAGTPELKLLNLDQTPTGDDELKLIHDFPHLQVLRLCRTRVTNAGLQHLQNLPALRELHMDDTQVTDEGMVHLLDLPSLSYIELMGCSITPRAQEVIYTRLPKCRIKPFFQTPGAN